MIEPSVPSLKDLAQIFDEVYSEACSGDPMDLLNFDEAEWRKFRGKTITKVEYNVVESDPMGMAAHDEVAITFSDGTGVVLKSTDAEHRSSWIELEWS